MSSLTGAISQVGIASLKGVQARIDQQNAQGGVDGRKLALDVVDDQSTAAQNLSGAQVEIQSKGDFGIIQLDSNAPETAPYTHNAGIPVVSTNDGVLTGTEPYTNYFGEDGSASPNLPVSSTIGTFLKQQGATNVGSAGYAGVPSSIGFALAIAKTAESAGLKAGYINTSVPFTGSNYTEFGVAMAKAGIDAFVPGLTPAGDLAMAQAATQAGAHLKVVLQGSFASDTWFGANAASINGDYFESPFQYPGLGTPASNNYAQAMGQYVGLSGLKALDHNAIVGWLAADLFITGLQLAGQNPTRASFLTNLRADTNYTGGGLETGPVDFSTDFGKGVGGQGPGQCMYVFHWVNGKVIPVNTTPICGTIIAPKP